MKFWITELSSGSIIVPFRLWRATKVTATKARSVPSDTQDTSITEDALSPRRRTLCLCSSDFSRPLTSLSLINSVLILLAVLAMTPISAESQSRSKTNSAFRVTAYLPDYRLATLDPARINGVTDLIFFSLQPTPTGDLDLTRLPPLALQKLHELVKGKKTLLLVAIGGWERSANFAPMATNEMARKRFVHALTQFCLDNQLAGADFDWEQPENPAEQQAYAKLLIATKRSFAPRHLRLTVALAPEPALPKAGLEAADAIHLMAYDHDGQHATEPQAELDLKTVTRLGISKKKILLGVPFYGRSVKDRNRDQTFAEIFSQSHPGPETDQVGEMYFNNIQTVQKKTRYALKNGFGGVMIWEIGQDADGPASLLEAIRQVLR